MYVQMVIKDYILLNGRHDMQLRLELVKRICWRVKIAVGSV